MAGPTQSDWNWTQSDYLSWSAILPSDGEQGRNDILREFFFFRVIYRNFWFFFLLSFLSTPKAKFLLEIDSPSIRQTRGAANMYNSQSWDGVMAKYGWWLVLSFPSFFKVIFSCPGADDAPFMQVLPPCSVHHQGNGDGAGRTDDRVRERQTGGTLDPRARAWAQWAQARKGQTLVTTSAV